jgi:O-antigen ligase
VQDVWLRGASSTQILHPGADEPRRKAARALQRAALWGALAAVALLLAWLPLRNAALLAATVAGGLLLLRRPWLIWTVVGAVLPFAAARDAGPASALDLLLAGAVALWFVDGVRRDSLLIAPSAPLVAALVYVLLLLISSARALDFGQALAEVVKWTEFAFVLALLPVMLWADGRTRQASDSHSDRLQVQMDRVRWVALGMVAGATAQALLGLYQFVFRIGPDWFLILGRYMRAAGTFGQPNPFAGYLGLVLPVAASLALWAWAEVLRGRDGAGRAAPGRLLLWALLWSGGGVLIGAGILASWSRGAWLGAAGALVTVVVLRSRIAAVVAGTAALLVLSLLLVGSLTPAGLQERIPEPVVARLAELPGFFGAGDPLAQEVTDENFAVIERVAHWVAALRMFEQSPWLGVGAGSYDAAYPLVRVPRWEEALGHAHNAYLNTLAEVGLAGAATVAALWATLVVWLVRALRQAGRQSKSGLGGAMAREQRALVVGVLGVLVHLAVHSLVDNLFVQGIYIVLAIWPALVAVYLLPRSGLLPGGALQPGTRS